MLLLLLYSKLKKDLQERLNARGQELQFTVAQIKSELKKLIGECKKVALTVKTATGIDRFQEQKNYGSWFPILFSLLKNGDFCQPERAVEPSTGGRKDVDRWSSASSASSVEESDESTVMITDDQMTRRFLYQLKLEVRKEKMCP